MAYSIFIREYVRTEEGSWVPEPILTIIHSNPEACWKEFKSLKLTDDQEAITDMLECGNCGFHGRPEEGHYCPTPS